MEHLIDALFDLSPQVRYVAIYRHGELSLRQRPDLSLASAPESDPGYSRQLYEYGIVTPPSPPAWSLAASNPFHLRA